MTNTALSFLLSRRVAILPYKASGIAGSSCLVPFELAMTSDIATRPAAFHPRRRSPRPSRRRPHRRSKNCRRRPDCRRRGPLHSTKATQATLSQLCTKYNRAFHTGLSDLWAAAAALILLLLSLDLLIWRQSIHSIWPSTESIMGSVLRCRLRSRQFFVTAFEGNS